MKAVVADVNGDGISDLVIAIPSVPEVAVLLGNGNGTFQSPKYSPYDGRDIAVADFNGDHKADLATPERLYLGSGDGYFHYDSLLPKSGILVLTGDHNKDGKADLAVIDLDIWTLLGNGHGDFTPKAVAGYTTANHYGVASWFSTDLNGDGKPDIVIQEEKDFGNYSGPNTLIRVEMGKGDGSFTAAPSLSDAFSFFIPTGITGLGDVNGDKKLDLVITGTGAVHTYIGKGNGTFQPFVGSNIECGLRLLFAMGDLNGDGRSDLLCDNNGSETFHSSNGNGSYTRGAVFALDTNGVGTNGIVIADLNRDGTRDAILLNIGSSVTVLLNLSGTSMAVTTTPSTLVYKQPFSVAASVRASIMQTPHPGGSVVYKNGSVALGSAAVGAALQVAARARGGYPFHCGDLWGRRRFQSAHGNGREERRQGNEFDQTHQFGQSCDTWSCGDIHRDRSAAVHRRSHREDHVQNGSTVLATVTMSSGKATYSISSQICAL